MIRDLLPPAVAVVEAFSDTDGESVFPGEEALVAKAVESRRREFVTGRRCAREALATLGFPAVPVLSGARREPLWPAGAVGSITHCVGYRAAAVARAADLASVGIDAEVDGALPRGVLDRIVGGDDATALAKLSADHPGTFWDKVLFSAKESIYKAWFPLTGEWLGFEDATVAFSPTSSTEGTFTGHVLIPAPTGLERFHGRFRSTDGLVVTAVTVPAGFSVAGTGFSVAGKGAA